MLARRVGTVRDLTEPLGVTPRVNCGGRCWSPSSTPPRANGPVGTSGRRRRRLVTIGRMRCAGTCAGTGPMHYLISGRPAPVVAFSHGSGSQLGVRDALCRGSVLA